MVAQFWTHHRAILGVDLFPQVAGRSESSDADGGNFAIELPDGIEAGDRLLVALSIGANDAFTPPDGWSSVVSGLFATTRRYAVFVRDVDGSEGFTGTDDTVVAAVAAGAVAFAWRLRRCAATAPALNSVAGTDATSHALNELNPSGWGTEHTLWIGLLFTSGVPDITAPAALPDGQRTIDLGDASTGHSLAAAERRLRAESLSPGAFTTSVATTSRAVLVAIRPAA